MDSSSSLLFEFLSRSLRKPIDLLDELILLWWVKETIHDGVELHSVDNAIVEMHETCASGNTPEILIPDLTGGN